MKQDETIAYRSPLPCTVPPGGAALVLADGRLVEGGVQGPGALHAKDWRSQGQVLEAIVLPSRALQLQFDLEGLHSQEGAGLTLTVTLALRIESPVQFLTDVVGGCEDPFTAEDLGDLLGQAIATGLAEPFRQRSLAELDADADLRAWLATMIEGYLTTGADLLGRSGLAVVGVDAFDLRCRVRDEARAVQETYYLRAALAGAEAAGRRFLDERLLEELRAHLPVKEDLVAHKEQLAALEEREQGADERLGAVRNLHQDRLRQWVADQKSSLSMMRPELWRVDLGQPVGTAPLADEDRVYVATKSGRVHSFDRRTGQPVWDPPVELGARPGDGLALADGRLWVPGHDGFLYGLDRESGAVVHRVAVGGQLSSAPVLDGGLLYLTVDVDPANLGPSTGQVVAVDPGRGTLSRRWPVSRRGLRAGPALWDGILYVGDRSGAFFALDLQRGAVESLPVGGGRILTSALVDAERGQVIVGNSYGQVAAFDRAGQRRWMVRLADGATHSPQASVVARPLIHGGVLHVPAGDGRVYFLDPDGQPVASPFQTRGPVATAPVAWGDLVFVGSNDGLLYALEAGGRGCFWHYHSGSPVYVSPAVSAKGRLYVVDCQGRLNALRWCLARYAEGARRLEEAASPDLLEIVDLWILAGETGAALEAAQRAGRLDLEAGLAAELRWYDRAALLYEKLAGRTPDPIQAELWYGEAANNWSWAQREEEADRCRLYEANNRRAPLLHLESLNRPRMMAGESDYLQMRVTNRTAAPAHKVELTYRGDVKRAGKQSLGTLGPKASRDVEIEITPTESGSALVRISAAYSDAAGRPQRPALLEVRLKVAEPPQVHHHYYGPHIGGDGVIMVRGSAGRSMRVQSGDDAIDLGPA